MSYQPLSKLSLLYQIIQNRFFKGDLKRFKQFATLSGLRFVDAIVGIVKDVFLTRAFGLNAFVDSYFVATGLLDLFAGYYQQMSYGILVTLYNERADESQDSHQINQQQAQIIVIFLNYMILSMGLLAIFMMLQYQWLGSITAPGLIGKKDGYLDVLLMISLPLCMLFQGSSALRVLFLQQKRFAFFHLPGIVSTLVFITVFWIFYPQHGVYSVVWGLPVAQCVQFLMYWFALKIRWEFIFKFPDMRKMLWLSLPNSLSWLFFYLFYPVDNYFLAMLPEGELSAFRYASKITGVLVALTVFSLQMTVVPNLMIAGSQNNIVEMKKLIRKGIRESFLWSIPLIITGIFLAPFAIKVLFERGMFSKEDTELVTLCFQILIFQLPYAGIWMFITRSYNSLYLVKSLMVVAFSAIILRFGMDWMGLHYGGIKGMAWMATAHYYIMLLLGLSVLLYLMKQKESASPALESSNLQ